MIEVKEAKTVGEIRLLEKPWNQLVDEKGLGRMSNSFDWVVSWFEHVKNSKPLVLSAWDKGKLVGIAPLCLEGNTLCLAGQLYASFFDFAAKKGLEQEASQALARVILEKDCWKKIKFVHLADSAILLEVMEKEAGKKGFVAKKTEGEPSNVIELPATEQLYFASLKKTRRRWLRKKLYRLERAFSVETRLVGREGFEEAWTGFIELHGRHIRLRQRKSVLQQQWFKNFYRSLAEKALKKDRLFLLQLNLDGKPAGSLFGVVFGKTLNAFNVGLDQLLAESYSLGKLLLLKAVKPCCEKGITRYDLLPGGQEYKKVFGTMQKSGLELHIFRTASDAMLYGLKWIAKKQAKKVLQKGAIGI